MLAIKQFRHGLPLPHQMDFFTINQNCLFVVYSPLININNIYIIENNFNENQVLIEIENCEQKAIITRIN